MAWSRRLARSLNRILPGEWRLFHPRLLPAGQPEPGSKREAAPRFYAFLGRGCAITTLWDGHFIFVDTRDEVVAAQLIARGYWETWIENVVRSLIRPGDQVIEVGANHGYYTLAMAAGVGPTGRVIAFEANPGVAMLLRRSISFNNYADRVTVYQKAVVDQAGSLTFSMSASDSGAGHIMQGGHLLGAEPILVEVEAVRLDDLFPVERIDLIRTDAEGSEPLIVEGARNLIDRSENIKLCLEWSMPMIHSRAYIPRFLAVLASRGFRFWKTETDSTLR